MPGSAVDTPYPHPLDLTKAAVLITGGSTGIGLGLAEYFLQAGSEVIAVGRRQDALDAAKKSHPALQTIQGDVQSSADRVRLANTVLTQYPQVNILVNNAGVIRMGNLTSGRGLEAGINSEADQQAEIRDWEARQSEIDINISGSVHLTSLFLPHLLKKAEAAVVFVSSYYGFAPSPISPNYSATKAFIHSYAISSREFLKNTKVQVVEILPPLVKTRMSGGNGEDLDEFCSSVFERFKRGEKEIGYKTSEDVRLADRAGLHKHSDTFIEQGAAFGIYKPY